MNYVDALKLFGVEAKEIPCIKGNGSPPGAEGAVGCLYMDTYTGEVYKRMRSGWAKLDGNITMDDVSVEINETLDIVVAAEYDPWENYSAGDLVTYEGSLLRFKVDHIGEGEDIDPRKVVTATIADELQRVGVEIKAYVDDTILGGEW